MHLCTPLRDVQAKAINDRLDTIEDLFTQMLTDPLTNA